MINFNNIFRKKTVTDVPVRGGGKTDRKGWGILKRNRHPESEEKTVPEEKHEQEQQKLPIQIPEEPFERLSYLAGLGDIRAMQMLGEWFRGRLSTRYQKLEADWEENPKEYGEKFEEYAKEHQQELFFARAGILWFIRAAAFGHLEALELVSKHKRWNRLSLIPGRFFYKRGPAHTGSLFTSPRMSNKFIISGRELKEAGFPDFSEDQEYEITAIGSGGMYFAKADTDERIGPDEDGFGMEWLYHFYIFDEFFHCIRCRMLCSERDYRNSGGYYGKGAEKMQEMYSGQRERYWGGEHLQAESVKYRCLPSELKGALIQDGVLWCYADCGESEYTIPETVHTIGFEAFCRSCDLKRIVVPETVRCIEERAFAQCDRLEEIILPANLKRIPKECFDYCSITQICLPEGLEEIEENAFRYSRLTEIRIPEGTRVGKNAFCSCWNLKSAVLFEGAEETGADAFSECRKLEIMTLPHSLHG